MQPRNLNIATIEARITELEKNGGGSGPSTNLEPATTTKLGGIKVGNNLDITSDGTLSARCPNITTSETLTGRVFGDKPTYIRKLDFTDGLTITTSGTAIMSSTGVTGVIDCKLVEPSVKGFANAKVVYESDGSIVVEALSDFGCHSIIIEYTK